MINHFESWLISKIFKSQKTIDTCSHSEIKLGVLSLQKNLDILNFVRKSMQMKVLFKMMTSKTERLLALQQKCFYVDQRGGDLTSDEDILIDNTMITNDLERSLFEQIPLPQPK